jgi:hypothetical protein
VGFGDLEGEEGDAAGAEDEDGLAGVEIAFVDEGVPGGEGSAGEGGGFFEREMRGGVDEAGFGEEVRGGEDAVDGSAEGGLARGGLDFAVEPVLEEEAADVVAGLEGSDVRADGGDDAGGVRAEDAGQRHGGVVVAEDDHEVAVVECGEVEVDEDLVGAEGGELGVGEGEVVDAEGGEGEGGGLGHGEAGSCVSDEVAAQRFRLCWMRQRVMSSRAASRHVE